MMTIVLTFVRMTMMNGLYFRRTEDERMIVGGYCCSELLH